MAGFTLDDVNWDQLLSGLTPAGQHKQALVGANVAAKQLETEQLRRQMLAAEEASKAGIASNALIQPPTTDFQMPSLPTYENGAWGMQPPQGDDGLPLAPIKVPMAWTDPAGVKQFEAGRTQADAYNTLAARLAKSAKDASDGLPAMNAQGRVLMSGMPPDVATQRALEFGTTGKFPSAADQSPYKDVASQLQYLDAATKKVISGQPLTPDETRTAQAIYETHFPVKTELKQSPETGAMTPYSYAEKPAPAYLDPLATRLYGRPPQVREVPERIPTAPPVGIDNAPPVAPNMPQWMPQATTGLMTTAPAAAAPAAAAAATPAAPAAQAAPPVEPVVPLQRGGVQVGAPVSGGNAKELRTEVQSNPAVKSYLASIPMWQQAVKQFEVNSPQADVAIIYTLAKILDPDSVVREGEYVTFQKTGGALDRLKGLYDQVTSSQAALTPQIRRGLADMGEKVMDERYKVMDVQRQLYSRVADSYGVNVNQVFPDLPAPTPVNRDTISKLNVSGQAQAAPQARSSMRGQQSAPAPTAVSPVDHDRVRQLLGLP